MIVQMRRPTLMPVIMAMAMMVALAILLPMSQGTVIVSDEYAITGKTGGDATKEMLDVTTHHCFLTGGGSFYHDERCRIVPGQVAGKDGTFWLLQAWSNQKSFSCRARCVASDAAVTDEVFEQGQASNVTTLAKVDGNYCFLTSGGGWDYGENYCTIVEDYLLGSKSPYWMLEWAGTNGYFKCGSRCVDRPGSSKLVPGAQIAGKLSGTVKKEMLRVIDGYCFISAGKAWYKAKEQVCTTHSRWCGSRLLLIDSIG